MTLADLSLLLRTCTGGGGSAPPDAGAQQQAQAQQQQHGGARQLQALTPRYKDLYSGRRATFDVQQLQPGRAYRFRLRVQRRQRPHPHSRPWLSTAAPWSAP